MLVFPLGKDERKRNFLTMADSPVATFETSFLPCLQGLLRKGPLKSDGQPFVGILPRYLATLDFFSYMLFVLAVGK